MRNERSGRISFNNPDHAIEHENRAFKVIGGIVGITQHEKALDKLFLIAPEMSKLLDEFAKEYDMGSNGVERSTMRSQEESSPE